MNHSISVKRLREDPNEIKTMGAGLVFRLAGVPCRFLQDRTVLSGAAAEYDPARLGRYELAELTPPRLKRYFASLSGGKAKNTYKLLRTILQQGVTAGLLAENPCTPEILGEEVLARRKAGPSREQPVFTREEQEKLLAVCEEELWGNLIRFAFATGLPQGELLALREEDVDLVASRLTVRNRVARIADEQSKERKTRLALLPVPLYSVPLPAACKRIVESQLGTLRTLQAVDARCNPDHLLFATPDGRPVEANVLREHLALLERRAGVPCLTFSTIRETAIRQALEDGGTDAEVMERFHCKDRQAFLRRYRPK